MRIELDEKQKQKAEELANGIIEGQINHPKDFLEEWKGTPDEGLCWGQDLVSKTNKETMVDPSKIKGTERVNIDRFEKNRILRVLKWLHKGEYKEKPPHPPDLNLIDGDYYVSSEGNHRSMSHKYLGIDKMYAEVTEWSIETEIAEKVIKEGKDFERVIKDKN